ncbi:diguanylate cyclase AdrA [Pseudorhodoferax sp. Leaf267]|uniref:sensor domain-containing diguanylate cyclase n=1 Tax=Pseudorhodoferax sp. Leaf267 TaxID=1736316 RepID=UPI0006FC9381|nr:diguanylate cyclase AdrA [Pseudorhodoferax sp. Leaf267]KQP22570.1 diguanylate cyclase [Pseudorhodoferax sp. Leaf267]
MADDLDHLPRLIYPLRACGMALGSLVVLVVLHERQSGPLPWALAVFCGFVWPHLAWWLTRRSAAPGQAELRNLLIDSAMAALFVPLMHFNLLPSVLLVTLCLLDKIATGIRWLWLQSLPGMLLAGLLGLWMTGAAVSPQTSMRVIVACLPLLVLHTLSVSLSSHGLIRRISHQNRLLDELRRFDPLTGLYARAYWEQQVELALLRHAADGESACLLMLDVDDFKCINDRCGHTVGDDVLRALSLIMRANVRGSDCAGRYGGDEFAILLRGADLAQAQEIAQRIRSAAERHRLRDHPDLCFTNSIGIAEICADFKDPRAWVAAADAALYEAKRAGRNRVEVRPLGRAVPVPTPA